MARLFHFIPTILLAVFIFGCSSQQPDYRVLIAKGDFSKAKAVIKTMLKDNLDMKSEEKKALLWEMERMERIKKDFTVSGEEVFDFIKKYIPNITPAMMEEWEKSKALEMRIIDGQKRYFEYAARNLFRIDPQCKIIWDEAHKQEKQLAMPPQKLDLNAHNAQIIKQTEKNNGAFVLPVRLHITYTITLKPDMVPQGETVHCWIPFPREIEGRQTDIELIRTDPADYRLAPKNQMQRTIYFEKASNGSKPTRFMVEYTYTNRGTYTHIDPQKVEALRPQDGLDSFLAERPPHIIFTEELKTLSGKIVGDEKNPYRVAQKLFEWIDNNIPWASAREYSSIRNISMYAYENKHGDCGIQTLLFITLLRLNGIPARWQSGWEFQPPDDSMHDWGMVYFKPYGWVPMDVTYGLRDSNDEKLKWFYLQGMDSYRLIFNDDFSQPFDPSKEHFRSETVDSQRGELEWSGGNLYFDQWQWDMQWKVVEN
ncbi:MAG TPA: transglutaminase domain-containing protein [Calditrichaeota bacterium]|nr:transglutaminase domain-containing protein [Calditrichota bacterium]